MERNKLHKTKKRSSLSFMKIVYAMYIYLIVWKISALHIRLLYFIGEKKITQKCANFLCIRNKLVRHSTVFDPPIFDREIVNQKMGLKRVTWKPIPNNSLLAGLPSSSFHILWANCHWYEIGLFDYKQSKQASNNSPRIATQQNFSLKTNNLLHQFWNTYSFPRIFVLTTF